MSIQVSDQLRDDEAEHFPEQEGQYKREGLWFVSSEVVYNDFEIVDLQFVQCVQGSYLFLFHGTLNKLNYVNQQVLIGYYLLN